MILEIWIFYLEKFLPSHVYRFVHFKQPSGQPKHTFVIISITNPFLQAKLKKMVI
jgi:hypothetical protein